MSGLETIALVAAIGGTAATAYGQYQAGQAQARNMKFQAAQAEREAKRAEAEGIAKASEQRRRANIVSSNARAAAGASGFAVDSPTYLDIEADIDAEGEYRSAMELYASREQRNQLYDQAAISRAGASDAAAGGFINAFGTLGTGAGSLYAKYGDSGSSLGKNIRWNQSTRQGVIA